MQLSSVNSACPQRLAKLYYPGFEVNAAKLQMYRLRALHSVIIPLSSLPCMQALRLFVVRLSRLGVHTSSIFFCRATSLPHLPLLFGTSSESELDFQVPTTLHPITQVRQEILQVFDSVHVVLQAFFSPIFATLKAI